MQPTLIISLLSALFVATHIGMATATPRAWMVSRLGEKLFVAIYSAVASVQFGVLLAYYAAHRFDGFAGPALGATPAIRWTLMAVIAIGLTLMGGSLVSYPDSPFGVLEHNFREPYGIERITRHAFFAGTFMLVTAHALLASHLNGTIVFSSLAILAVAGARHQDTKLLRRGGNSYRRYLETTSMVPFAAIAAGRQRIAWQELPVKGLAIALATAVGLRLIHDWIFAHGGLFVIAAVVGGAGILGLVNSLRHRSHSRQTPGSEPRPAADSARFMRGT